MFNAICDKYEEVSSQLKENQTQLHVAKSALEKHQKAASIMRKDCSNVETQTETHLIESTSLVNGIENRTENDGENALMTEGIENGLQAEEHGGGYALMTEGIENRIENESLSSFQLAMQLDHPYATTKPFSCKYCLTKFTRKHSRNKHIPICKARQTYNFDSSDDDGEQLFENNQSLYTCQVCAKQYTYDKMRKHYSQFINSSGSRKNRNGHGEVSLSTHISYLNELKASKLKKK